MTEPIVLGLIGTFGTLVTIIGAIVQQGMGLSKAAKEQKAIKEVATETNQVTTEARVESKEGFASIEAFLLDMQAKLEEKLDKLQSSFLKLTQERLRFLLTQYQDSDTITFSEKEILDGLYKDYSDAGWNGTIKAMYERECARLKVVK